MPFRTLVVMLVVCATIPGGVPGLAADKGKPSGREETIEELLKLHNKERKAEGAGPLTVNPKLQEAAQDYAEYLAENNEFSHAAHGTVRSRVKDAGYKGGAVAENIAKGNGSPEAVVDGWMHSPGHRKNLVNDRYDEVGFGFAKDAKGHIVWVTVFGHR